MVDIPCLCSRSLFGKLLALRTSCHLLQAVEPVVAGTGVVQHLAASGGPRRRLPRERGRTRQGCGVAKRSGGAKVWSRAVRVTLAPEMTATLKEEKNASANRAAMLQSHRQNASEDGREPRWNLLGGRVNIRGVVYPRPGAPAGRHRYARRRGHLAVPAIFSLDNLRGGRSAQHAEWKHT